MWIYTWQLNFISIGYLRQILLHWSIEIPSLPCFYYLLSFNIQNVFRVAPDERIKPWIDLFIVMQHIKRAIKIDDKEPQK